MATGFPPPAPTRDDVHAKLRALVDGTVTAEEAHDWAVQWIAATDAGVDDMIVWEGLMTIIHADGRALDGGYLYSRDDFEDWLAEFEASLPRQ